MPSSYSPRLRIELQATGENRSTWGQKANNDFTLFEGAISGVALIDLADSDHTLTTANGLADEARMAILLFTGTLTANRTVTIPTVSKIYMVNNATTGGFSVAVKTSAIGGSIATVLPNTSQLLWTDGTFVFAGSPPEAPADGKTYVRKNNTWVELVLPPQPFTYDVNGDAVLKFSGNIMLRIKPTGLILTKDDIEVFSTSV